MTITRTFSAAGFLGFFLATSSFHAQAQIVISELLYDAAGGDNGAVFVELYGTPGESLDGLFVEGVNGADGSVYRSVALAGVIPPDGVFVIADDSGDGTTLVTDFDFIAEVDFQNGPDSVVLRSADGVLDALGYGDFSSAVFAGEGLPAMDTPAGSSLARVNVLLDSNDNAADFFALMEPTPGTVPPTAVPLPASLWLLLSGLTGFLGIARRKRSRHLTREPRARIMPCHVTRTDSQSCSHHRRQLARA